MKIRQNSKISKNSDKQRETNENWILALVLNGRIDFYVFLKIILLLYYLDFRI